MHNTGLAPHFGMIWGCDGSEESTGKDLPGRAGGIWPPQIIFRSVRKRLTSGMMNSRARPVMISIMTIIMP